MTREQFSKLNSYINQKGIENIGNVVVVGKNATNGDVIKALFPKAPIKYERYLVRIYFYDNATIEITFHKCWWDAQYKQIAELKGDNDAD